MKNIEKQKTQKDIFKNYRANHLATLAKRIVENTVISSKNEDEHVKKACDISEKLIEELLARGWIEEV